MGNRDPATQDHSRRRRDHRVDAVGRARSGHVGIRNRAAGSQLGWSVPRQPRKRRPPPQRQDAQGQCLSPARHGGGGLGSYPSEAQLAARAVPADPQPTRAPEGDHRACSSPAHPCLPYSEAWHRVRGEGENYRDPADKPKAVERLVTKLQQLGFYVTMQPVPPELSGGGDNVAPAPLPKRKRGRPL